jgi:hypothetical protein
MISTIGLFALAHLAQTAPLAGPPIRITTDSSQRAVIVEYRIADPPATASHEHHGSHAAHVQRMVRFTSPITGWFRAARLEMFDAAGMPISQRSLHHFNLLNLSRRQLVHGGVERMFAAGQETEAIELPAGVGMPISSDMMLGIVVAYDPSQLLPGSLVRLHLHWTPRNTTPRPVDIFPLPLDVNYAVGRSAAYDLPPGRSERSHEFVMPISGRMLGVGGHMHDYGVLLRLEEAETGKRVFELRAKKDSTGKLISIPREVYGIAGRGRKLEGGRRYRVTAVYDNPTGAMIPLGGMGEIGIGFTPDDMDDWPPLLASDPDVAGDLAHLASFEDR